MRYVSAVKRQLLLGLGGDEASDEDFFVESDEEAFGASEDSSIQKLQVSLMEELAAFAPQMGAGEDERLVNRGGAEIVDLHVAGHGEDIQRAVELAHGFIHERGDDASVDIAGRAFVKARELEVPGGGDCCRVEVEGEMEALRVIRATGEAVACAFVYGRLARRMRRHRMDSTGAAITRYRLRGCYCRICRACHDPGQGWRAIRTEYEDV
jgi:hypothetical protein